MATLPYIDVNCGFGASLAAPEWQDAAAIRAGLRQRGIGKAFLISRIARRFDPLAGNDAVAAAVATEAGDDDVDLRGWLVVHPARVGDAQQQMRRHLLSDRFIGAALFPDPVTGRPVSARDAAEVVTSFRRYSKPLLVHTPNAAAMAEALRLAEQFQGVKIIASGMGGDEWREAIVLAARPLNLLLDISGALNHEKLDFALQTFGGVRKLLFASGAPDTDPAAVLSMLFESSVPEEDRARILYGNAQRLFGMGEEEEEPATLTPMSSL
jgi:predicted TIM-barrel fold metal-dependent hydrolase